MIYMCQKAFSMSNQHDVMCSIRIRGSKIVRQSTLSEYVQLNLLNPDPNNEDMDKTLHVVGCRLTLAIAHAFLLAPCKKR